MLFVHGDGWARQDDVFGVAGCRLTRHHRLSRAGWTGCDDDRDTWVFEQDLVQTVRHLFTRVSVLYIKG